MENTESKIAELENRIEKLEKTRLTFGSLIGGIFNLAVWIVVILMIYALTIFVWRSFDYERKNLVFGAGLLILTNLITIPVTIYFTRKRDKSKQ